MLHVQARRTERRNENNDPNAISASQVWSANESEADLSAILGSLLKPSEEHEFRINNIDGVDDFDVSESVARLVAEEAEDVSVLLSGLRADPHTFPLAESLRHLHRDIRAMPIGDNPSILEEGDDPENLSAAEIAGMMYRLEHGISMSAPPHQLFKFLFPDEEAAARPEEVPQPQPPAPEGGPPVAPGEASAGGTFHKKEPCPIICFGGSDGRNVFSTHSEARTAVQLRGNQPPPWFPGYYMALPQTGGLLQVKGSPTDVMQAAYLAARPRNIPPRCRVVY